MRTFLASYVVTVDDNGLIARVEPFGSSCEKEPNTDLVFAIAKHAMFADRMRSTLGACLAALEKSEYPTDRMLAESIESTLYEMNKT